jgi:hypothetical protein
MTLALVCACDRTTGCTKLHISRFWLSSPRRPNSLYTMAVTGRAVSQLDNFRVRKIDVSIPDLPSALADLTALLPWGLLVVANAVPCDTAKLVQVRLVGHEI